MVQENPSERALKPMQSAAERLGFWLASTLAAGGVVYICVVAALVAQGQFVMPPPQSVQLFGGVWTMLAAPLLVALMACVHESAPAGQKVYSLSGLVFTVLFAAMVCINRYVQLTVVQQGLIHGTAGQLGLILPYGSDSFMFSLEILGWGFFFGLAALCVSPMFSGPGLERWLRGLFIVYAVLGVASAVGLVFASPVAAVGFIAWGPVLDVIVALLAIWFRRKKTNFAHTCEGFSNTDRANVRKERIQS